MFPRPQKVIIQLVKKSPGTPLRMGTEERDVTEKKKGKESRNTTVLVSCCCHDKSLQIS